MERIGLVVVGLAGLLSFSACSSMERTGEASGNVASAANAVDLRVVNNNFSDVDVYAVRNGERTRIGTVTGNSTQSFTLGPSLFPTNDLSLIAVPIGGFGAASSGRLSVSAGDQIDFRIMPVLNQSTAVLRPPR